MAASFRSTERPPMPWILSCHPKASCAVSSARAFGSLGASAPRPCSSVWIGWVRPQRVSRGGDGLVHRDSQGPVIVAAFAGGLYGALVLPRLPIGIASASGRLSMARLAVGAAIPVAVVALVALTLAEPRAGVGPQQAAAL